MLPEEKARVKIDKQLIAAGWEVVSRNEYTPNTAAAVKEALMMGGTESDYLLFIEDRAIAVVEAKKETSDLGAVVAKQAEDYAVTPQRWYGLWYPGIIPLVYLANGNKILFKNMLTNPDGDYEELPEMPSPKKMLQLIGKESDYGALPRIEKRGLRDCQYDAEIKFEQSLKQGKRKALAVLATGSGKTYLACLAAYRLLEYTPTKRILFLVDRNNLARQTESEFSRFDRTEKHQQMKDLYQINRLRNADDTDGDIVISTIQKLFAVLTGQAMSDEAEDSEDEKQFSFEDDDQAQAAVDLGGDLKLPPDHFQLIIIDECHRSIYGKWQSVLNYFSGAKILGLTATPTPEAHAFFNENVIARYTYDTSVVDGVNVPARVYRIKSAITEHGGAIRQGEIINEITRSGNQVGSHIAGERIDYSATQLDRSIIVPDQIETVIKAYRDSIYTDLYPDRNETWEYIPKTLIFAKNDNHATQIVEIVKQVFAEKFEAKCVPEKFVQKITYSAGDSNALIRDLIADKEFRIAVTVTLVATGTDVKPLEVVLFMNDVKSEVLYTQMKGRGCRVINEDKLKEVTPNAITKECYFVVDAVGVTEHDKSIPNPGKGSNGKGKTLKLEPLLEHLAHGEVSDDNLAYLRDYCASIHRRYENDPLFGRHLNLFVSKFGFAPKTLANDINIALAAGALPPFTNVSDDNTARKTLIAGLLFNIEARKKLLELHRGYYAVAPERDKIIEKGFTKEAARSFIDSFEKYLTDHADSVEALRIIYNSEDAVITYSMLTDLRDKLISENRLFTPYNIWSNYKLLDTDGSVEDLDVKQRRDINALTHLIQLVRYAYQKNDKLRSLLKGYSQRFELYCGQIQRMLTDDQREVMKQIADYVIENGSVGVAELNEFNPDLWRKAVSNFKISTLEAEIIDLSKFILRVA